MFPGDGEPAGGLAEAARAVVGRSGDRAGSIDERIFCHERIGGRGATRAHWGHSAGMESLRKQKYDRLDAKRLARKLAVRDQDPLPEAWFPPPAIRALRLLARRRCWLAGMRPQVRNRVQSLLQMQGLRSPVTDVFGEAGRSWLGAQGMPEATRESVEQLLRVHDDLSQEIEQAERNLRAAGREFTEVARPWTIPGFGEILAPLIWSEIGRLERFRSARAHCNCSNCLIMCSDNCKEVKNSLADFCWCQHQPSAA
jgi:transposase